MVDSVGGYFLMSDDTIVLETHWFPTIGVRIVRGERESGRWIEGWRGLVGGSTTTGYEVFSVQEPSRRAMTNTSNVANYGNRWTLPDEKNPYPQTSRTGVISYQDFPVQGRAAGGIAGFTGDALSASEYDILYADKEAEEIAAVDAANQKKAEEKEEAKQEAIGGDGEPPIYGEVHTVTVGAWTITVIHDEKAFAVRDVGLGVTSYTPGFLVEVTGPTTASFGPYKTFEEAMMKVGELQSEMEFDQDQDPYTASRTGRWKVDDDGAKKKETVVDPPPDDNGGGGGNGGGRGDDESGPTDDDGVADYSMLGKVMLGFIAVMVLLFIMKRSGGGGDD